MQVTCEKCSAKYNIADDKIKSTGTAVRCPKCQAVFKVFGGATPGPAVACANCGKQTASVPGQAVVFCDECRNKLAGDSGGNEDFSGANLFGGAPEAPKSDDPFAGNIFGDEPAAPVAPAAPAAPPAPAPGGLFDEPAAPSGGGGLFDEPAAPAAGGSLFDEPAAPAGGGGLFDDAPAKPAAESSLFDEPAAPAGGSNLFDEPAGDTGGGLFDDAPQPPASAAADPFGDFDAPAGGGAAAAPQEAADPFAEFSSQPDDGMGFQETPEESAAASAAADAGMDGALGDEEPVSGPVREKAAPQFKKKELSGKDRILELLTENGAKIGIAAGAVVALVLVILVAALALLPGSFQARPTREDDKPGMLAALSFTLQEKLGTAYYGKAMEDAFLKSGQKAMAAWSGRGFTSAEKEYNELLAFDANNAAAKAALVELYATWDLVRAAKGHEKQLLPLFKEVKPTGETLARALLALGQYAEAATAAAAVPEKKELYAGMAAWYAGDVSGAVAALGAYAKKTPADFLGSLYLARALRDARSYAEADSAYTAAARLGNGNAEANLELGMLYYGPLASEEKALRVLTEATEDKAGAPEALRAEAKYYLAHILQRRGRVPQALDAVQEALKAAPANPRYLTRLGNIYFDINKTYDAYTAYDKARASDPKYVEAYIGLGRAKEKLEKQTEALELYKKAIDIDPVNMQANFLYAGLVLRQGRKDEAERVFTAVLEREPENIEAISHLATFYVDQQRNGDALKQFARIIELQPNKIDGYIGRGSVLLLEKDTAGAKKMFEHAASLDPANPMVLFRLGQAAYLENDFATAAKSLQEALAKDPYHWESHLYMGMTHFQESRFDEALKEYQKALDVNERAAEVYRQRALVYLKQAALDANPKTAAIVIGKAVGEMERALYYNPGNADYYFDYGVSLNASGLAGKAKDQWMKAKELRPGFKEAMFAMADYYVSFTDYGNAEAILKEVLKTSPKNAQAYLGMGKVYLAKGSLDEAYRAFSRAAQLEPKNADAQNLIGEVFDRQGLTNQAFTHFQRALRLDPKHGVAHFNLSLYWKDRDPKKAKQEVKAAIQSGTLTKEKAEEAQNALKELEYLK